MSRENEEYEYCEQMLSVYAYQKRKMEKQFKHLNPEYNAVNTNEQSLGIAVLGNLLYVGMNLERFAEYYSAMDFCTFELASISVSYLAIQLLEQLLFAKRLENIDLDQLEMNYYNTIEKEKGMRAQMAMLNSRDAKVYTKKKNEDFSFYE